jgi:hypothetical protein
MWQYEEMTEEEFKAFEKSAKDTLTREHIWRINHICPLIQKTCIEGACAAFCAPVFKTQPLDPIPPPRSRWEWMKNQLSNAPAPRPAKIQAWAFSAKCYKEVFDRSSQVTKG